MEVRTYREELLARANTPLTQEAIERLGNFSSYLKDGRLTIPPNAPIYAELHRLLRDIRADDHRRALDPLRERIAKQSSWETVEETAKLLWSDLGAHIYALMTPKQREYYWQILWDAMVCMTAAATIGDREIVNHSSRVIRFIAPSRDRQVH